MKAISRHPRKAALLLYCIAALLAVCTTTVRAQSALDGFDPNADDAVYVVTVQSDGKILIGGAFTTVLGVARNGIARLNPDGTLDTAFNPNADATVLSIVVQADGKILAGGTFTNIGGQARDFIARLDATTGLADSFNPNADSTIFSVAVQVDGKILVGGFFSDIGGQTRNNIARLDAATGLADSFDPNPDGPVNSIVIQPGGKLLVGGDFTTIGGQTRSRMARVDAATGLADSFDPNVDGPIYAVAVRADGQVFVGGDFLTIGGQPRNRIARLDATTGAADATFNPNANETVESIAIEPDGKILVVGQFNGASSIGGQTRNRIARLDPTTGAADAMFNPNANSDVYAVTVQVDGKIVVGGAFTTLAPNGGSPVTRNSIARLESDGGLDQTLNLNAVGSIATAVAVQPDGKILIGGSFSTVLGVARNNIARLNTDGTLDVAFNPNANNQVYAISVQTDGRIVAGGSFTTIGGQTRNRLARLDPATGLADSFNPNANSDVYAIATQVDGKILAGGSFTTIGGQARNRIARLDATVGSADLSFNPNANLTVLSIALQADGKILVGGQFNGASSIGGQTRNRIARLVAANGLADSLDPNASGDVQAIAVQPDGKILVGGQFNGANSIGGQTRNRVARLDPATGLADAFNPNASGAVLSISLQADGKVLVGGQFNGATSIGGQTRNRIARLASATGLADTYDPNASGDVNAIAVQADGKILAGGTFTTIGGQSRNRFARLSNDTAALQNFSVTQTTVTWTRGGSSRQFSRVTFDASKDSVNYSSLGNGTAAGSNWTLTGLFLPTSQNLYVRARGYYRSGNQNGSESVMEFVRNVFLVSGTINISGTISYCPSPSLNPVPGVTLTLTGSASGSTVSSGSGSYTFTALASGGSYTVTPTKTELTAGSAGINTVDVIATQRHSLNIGIPLAGCQLTAADVNGDAAVNTVDVIAIQRFSLNQISGLANVGKYRFSPVSRSYSGPVDDQAGQNYDALVFGDVVSTFVH